MKRWEKVNTVIYNNGEKDITYAAEGLNIRVQSRRRHIPHANGSGYWDSTSYVLLDPSTGEQVGKKTYYRLRDAQAEAELTEVVLMEVVPT